MLYSCDMFGLGVDVKPVFGRDQIYSYYLCVYYYYIMSRIYMYCRLHVIHFPEFTLLYSVNETNMI